MKLFERIRKFLDLSESEKVRLDRRAFLRGMAVTSAGLLVPAATIFDFGRSLDPQVLFGSDAPPKWDCCVGGGGPGSLYYSTSTGEMYIYTWEATWLPLHRGVDQFRTPKEGVVKLGNIPEQKVKPGDEIAVQLVADDVTLMINGVGVAETTLIMGRKKV